MVLDFHSVTFDFPPSTRELGTGKTASLLHIALCAMSIYFLYRGRSIAQLQHKLEVSAEQAAIFQRQLDTVGSNSGMVSLLPIALGAISINFAHRGRSIAQLHHKLEVSVEQSANIQRQLYTASSKADRQLKELSKCHKED